MLVRTFSHLIPHSDGAPTVLSSPSTSTYIPDIPYDDFARTHHVHPESSNVVSSRRDRRMRVAPYPLSISTSAVCSQSQQYQHRTLTGQQTVHLHSPRPVAFVNPVQAFDNGALNAHLCSPLSFSPGAHGTILDSFASRSESTTFPNSSFDEVTATQMAYMQAPAVSARRMPSSLHLTSLSACPQLDQAYVSGPSFPEIQVPRVPSIPQIASAPPPLRSNGAPHLPDAIPPETSQLHIKPSDTLAPPSDTFPTPVELLGELSIRDAEAAQKDRRRSERRKAHMMQEAETLGYTPTDPDTISTHDKKRLYLDCLEQYVIYLHNQLRLAGHEPVPVERVSSGRGLTSRSIRTMIVHLKTMTSKLHAQKKEAERKYDELRAQLGAEASLMIPTQLAGSLGNTDTYPVQQQSGIPGARPRRESSLSASGDTASVSSSSSVAHAPRLALDCHEVSTVTVTAHEPSVSVHQGSIPSAYSFP